MADTTSAYDAWLNDPDANHEHICAEPNPHCRAWLIEQLDGWLNGEQLTFSWRVKFKEWESRVPYMQGKTIVTLSDLVRNQAER